MKYLEASIPYPGSFFLAFQLQKSIRFPSAVAALAAKLGSAADEKRLLLVLLITDILRGSKTDLPLGVLLLTGRPVALPAAF